MCRMKEEVHIEKNRCYLLTFQFKLLILVPHTPLMWFSLFFCFEIESSYFSFFWKFFSFLASSNPQDQIFLVVGTIDILLKFFFFSIRHPFSDDLSTFERDQDGYMGRFEGWKLYNYILKNKKNKGTIFIMLSITQLFYHFIFTSLWKSFYIVKY